MAPLLRTRSRGSRAGTPGTPGTPSRTASFQRSGSLRRSNSTASTASGGSDVFYNAAEYPIEFHGSPEKMLARHASFDRRVQRNSGSSGSSVGSSPGTPPLSSRIATAAASSLSGSGSSVTHLTSEQRRRLQEKQAIERRLARMQPAPPAMRQQYRQQALSRLNMRKKQAEMNRLANAMNMGWSGARSRPQAQAAARARWKVAGAGAVGMSGSRPFMDMVSSSWDALDSLFRRQGGITGTAQSAAMAFLAQTEAQPGYLYGAMRALHPYVAPVWKKVGGPATRVVLPAAFYLYVRGKVEKGGWLPPRVARLIDWDVVQKVITRHAVMVGDFMTGKRVNLKPLAMDLAASVNHCAVYGIMAQAVPGITLPTACA